MPSLQNPTGNSKAAKFAAANPLGPMANPFDGDGLNDEQQEYQKVLSDNINKRLTKAVKELEEKHQTGTNEVDDPDRAPTGEIYLAIQRKSAARQALLQQQQQQEREREVEEIVRVKRNLQQQQNNSEDDDDDSEFDDLLDDDNDPALEALRQQRLQELKEAQIQHAEHVSKGHGQVRTITQDEFLPECTGTSEWVAIHFFHKEFERCQIMDFHLARVAPLHYECKFLRINAEKAPFFISKLQIKMLPTLLVFREGKSVARLTGFEGLANSINPEEPDKWHTGRLQQWLAETGAIQYTVPTEEVREEMARLGIRSSTLTSSIRRGGMQEYNEEY